VAVTTLEFDEVTVVAESGPVRLLSAWTSLSRFVASVWIWVNAVVWLWRAVICDCQASSGASAAVTAELTAALTSMPALEAPVAASRMSLISIADEGLIEESRELRDEVELIRCRVFLSC
jgi:hypothetical protein